MSTSFCSAAVFKLKRMVGVVLVIFHCFLWPDVSLSFGEVFEGYKLQVNEAALKYKFG